MSEVLTARRPVAICLGCGDDQPVGVPCDRCGLTARAEPEWLSTLVVYGEPVSQKNSRNVITKGRRKIPIANKRVELWHESAWVQLRNQWQREPINRDEQICATINAYLGKGQTIDADNLAAAPLDALQRARVVHNDYQIVELHVYRRRDRERPRIEITLQRSNAPWESERQA